MSTTTYTLLTASTVSQQWEIAHKSGEKLVVDVRGGVATVLAGRLENAAAQRGVLCMVAAKAVEYSEQHPGELAVEGLVAQGRRKMTKEELKAALRQVELPGAGGVRVSFYKLALLATVKAAAIERGWALIDGWTDLQIVTAMGRHYTPAGAVAAVERALVAADTASE